MSTPAAFLALLRRDLTIALHQRGEALQPLLFCALAIALFVLAARPEPSLLQAMGAPVLWVTALFATLLALPRLFHQDFADTFLEQLLLSPHPPSVLITAKITAHWLTTALPLILTAPLFAAMLNLPAHILPELLTSLLLGTPTLSLLGALASALTLATRNTSSSNSGTLLAILILPLYTPILIFGAGAIRLALLGLDASGALLWLAALLLLALALTPLATAAALRISLQ